MSLRENYNIDNLQNEAEILVFEEMDKQLEKLPHICKCEECVLDMAALALNKIKPYYRVSLLGRLYADSSRESEYAKEVKEAVIDAIKKISKNPAHEVSK
ncbi:MAG: late competence development ComFB family protein [Spirochaetales bacterium]|nr:late competence development ComFB family protein [Spirochaetales bacterium]